MKIELCFKIASPCFDYLTYNINISYKQTKELPYRCSMNQNYEIHVNYLTINWAVVFQIIDHIVVSSPVEAGIPPDNSSNWFPVWDGAPPQKHILKNQHGSLRHISVKPAYRMKYWGMECKINRTENSRALKFSSAIVCSPRAGHANKING